MARDMHAARLVVDVRYPQALPPRIEFGEAACEEAACCRETIELQREFGTLVTHRFAVSDFALANDAN